MTGGKMSFFSIYPSVIALCKRRCVIARDTGHILPGTKPIIGFSNSAECIAWVISKRDNVKLQSNHADDQDYSGLDWNLHNAHAIRCILPTPHSPWSVMVTWRVTLNKVSWGSYYFPHSHTVHLRNIATPGVVVAQPGFNSSAFNSQEISRYLVRYLGNAFCLLLLMFCGGRWRRKGGGVLLLN